MAGSDRPPRTLTEQVQGIRRLISASLRSARCAVQAKVARPARSLSYSPDANRRGSDRSICKTSAGRHAYAVATAAAPRNAPINAARIRVRTRSVAVIGTDGDGGELEIVDIGSQIRACQCATMDTNSGARQPCRWFRDLNQNTISREC